MKHLYVLAFVLSAYSMHKTDHSRLLKALETIDTYYGPMSFVIEGEKNRKLFLAKFKDTWRQEIPAALHKPFDDHMHTIYYHRLLETYSQANIITVSEFVATIIRALKKP